MSSHRHPEFHETRLRVRYAETDQMGVVYHSNHLIWFEVGRVELLREMGFSYRDMEHEDGRFIAVAEVQCRYRAPVYYDEEIVVRTRLKKVRESVVIFSYELVRAERPNARGRGLDHAHRHRFNHEGCDAAGEVLDGVSRSNGKVGITDCGWFGAEGWDISRETFHREPF